MSPASEVRRGGPEDVAMQGAHPHRVATRLPGSETCSGSFWKTPRAQKARLGPARARHPGVSGCVEHTSRDRLPESEWRSRDPNQTGIKNESPQTRGPEGRPRGQTSPRAPGRTPRPTRCRTRASVPLIWFPGVGHLPLLPGPCSGRHPVASLLPRPHREALCVPTELRGAWGAGGGGPGAAGPVPRSKHHQDPLGSWCWASVGLVPRVRAASPSPDVTMGAALPWG